MRTMLLNQPTRQLYYCRNIVSPKLSISRWSYMQVVFRLFGFVWHLTFFASFSVAAGTLFFIGFLQEDIGSLQKVMGLAR